MVTKRRVHIRRISQERERERKGKKEDRKIERQIKRERQRERNREREKHIGTQEDFSKGKYKEINK